MTVLESKTFTAVVAFVEQTQRAAEDAFEASKISRAQFFVLRALEHGPAATQLGIAEALGVTIGNVSQLLAKLEHADLVHRVVRGKSKRVSLSKRGELLVRRLRPEHEAVLRTRLAPLCEAEQKLLLSLVERLIRPSSASPSAEQRIAASGRRAKARSELSTPTSVGAVREPSLSTNASNRTRASRDKRSSASKRAGRPA